MRYWLMKTEPDQFSIDDLAHVKSEPWDGVRNYQARNFMRDTMAVGDPVLFYHSNARPPGVAGIAHIASGAYPDPTQFNRKSKYYDPKATKTKPRWYVVDVAYNATFKEIIPLSVLKNDPKLSKMALMQAGQRLSIQPVSQKEFKYIKTFASYKK